MARRRPYDLHDSSLSDQAMMEEVLELLGSESTTSSQAKKSSATFITNRDAACNEAANENEVLGCDEEKYLTKQELPLDQAQPMQSSMYALKPLIPLWTCQTNTRESDRLRRISTPSFNMHSRPNIPMQLTETASKRPSLLPEQLVHGAVPQSFAADPCFVDVAAAPESRQSLPARGQEHMMVREMITSALVPISPPASVLRHISQHSQPLSKSATLVTQLNAESNVLPTGQRVRVINPDEFEERRRKVQMQTASRRYRKRKKEATRHKKMHVQELQEELSRLQYMEAQTKQYQQRSVESLQQELKMYQDEVADLSGKIEDAAREELDWVTHFPL